MKTISELRKEIIRDHLINKTKGDEINLYKLNKKLIKLNYENNHTQIPM